jgi:hypothetical protein
MALQSRTRIVLTPIFASGADVAMTLVGQPPNYWSGQFSDVDEFNPLARLLLSWHPGWFIAAALTWWLILILFLLRANAGLAVAIAHVVTFLHAMAAGAWMVRLFGMPGVVAAVALLVICERLLRSGSQTPPSTAVTARP